MEIMVARVLVMLGVLVALIALVAVLVEFLRLNLPCPVGSKDRTTLNPRLRSQGLRVLLLVLGIHR